MPAGRCVVVLSSVQEDRLLAVVIVSGRSLDAWYFAGKRLCVLGCITKQDDTQLSADCDSSRDVASRNLAPKHPPASHRAPPKLAHWLPRAERTSASKPNNSAPGLWRSVCWGLRLHGCRLQSGACRLEHKSPAANSVTEVPTGHDVRSHRMIPLAAGPRNAESTGPKGL